MAISVLIQPIKCGKCEYEWDVPMESHPPLDVYVATIKAIVKTGCPKCHERKNLGLLPTRSGIVQ